jgi:hypothetical protein
MGAGNEFEDATAKGRAQTARLDSRPGSGAGGACGRYRSGAAPFSVPREIADCGNVHAMMLTINSSRTVFVALAWLLCWPVQAQVTIKDPDHLQVPEPMVEALFHSTCQVVAQEFHVRRTDVDFPLVLVLGDPRERYTSDEDDQLYTVYLYRWNDAQFALSSMRLAIEHMVTQTRRDRVVREILKRSNKISTVSIDRLQKQK